MHPITLMENKALKAILLAIQTQRHWIYSFWATQIYFHHVIELKLLLSVNWYRHRNSASIFNCKISCRSGEWRCSKLVAFQKIISHLHMKSKPNFAHWNQKDKSRTMLNIVTMHAIYLVNLYITYWFLIHGLYIYTYIYIMDFHIALLHNLCLCRQPAFVVNHIKKDKRIR